ncbi:hypothetical protein AUEXF2481DRAFT_501971 [Aureobasidium subglaciale EXF-2481]|uniref:Uncharacterized protein n=1 Tax=Aureobasidium subglaciale (strain EXF-2481) TaxID=1043005 RepID=A0A074YWZ7_AURSE|nr:uncharacterized protein AUEXF2481DRAFT_501971 [Aureobasidium subglaciale EXF-2481]KEQ91401.1 hypothetical protein AUEXF2481DRAFT_501971 [Aureobasidium subglaciale EXF-2481]
MTRRSDTWVMGQDFHSREKTNTRGAPNTFKKKRIGSNYGICIRLRPETGEKNADFAFSLKVDLLGLGKRDRETGSLSFGLGEIDREMRLRVSIRTCLPFNRISLLTCFQSPCVLLSSCFPAIVLTLLNMAHLGVREKRPFFEGKEGPPPRRPPNGNEPQTKLCMGPQSKQGPTKKQAPPSSPSRILGKPSKQ